MIFTKTRISVVAMACLAAGSITYMNHAGLQTGAFESVKTATMDIPDTNGLLVGSRVLLRGVAIGTITAVRSSADQVEVSMKYQRGYRIPVDSMFRVDDLSALGEAYLAILPRGTQGPYLPDHADIPHTHVVVPTTFQELSARLTRMLEQVDPNHIKDIFDTMDVALPDDVQVIGNLNNAGQLLATAITQQAGNLTKLFDAMQPLLLKSATVPGDLAGATPDIAKFAREFSDMIDGMHFAVDKGPLLGGIKYGAGPFIDQLQGFLDKTAGDLHVLGRDLLPGVQAGAAAMRTVPVSQLLDNALAATASGDAVTIHVRAPGR